MSVEALVITAIVEEGSPKPVYRAGVGKDEFQIYSEEFEWIEHRFERRKPINRRLFRKRFEDFEYLVPKEKLDDLLEELKTERAYTQLAALIETASETLLPENTIETAEHMREVISNVVRNYSPHSEISIKDSKEHFEKVRQHRILAKAGHTIGMPLLIPSIDFHFDGLQPGRLIGILGRPGEGKSFLVAWMAWISVKTGYTTGLFSPEMNEFEHRCRLHTLASADPEVQAAIGLKRAFRNRDLMRGTGFNLKEYKRFLEYFESLPGRCELFTKKYRKNSLTLQYVASRVEDMGMHGIIADPLSKLSTGVRRRDNPVWEAYDKVSGLQEIAEEQNIFAVATNWATRQQGRAKSEKAPDLDDSFGSDALAQESDHIIGVKHDPEERMLTLRCTKSRFGKPKFNSIIEFHPNTGVFQEVNIDHDVMSYRISLNGKAAQNGNGHRPHVEKAKPKKVVKNV